MKRLLVYLFQLSDFRCQGMHNRLVAARMLEPVPRKNLLCVLFAILATIGFAVPGWAQANFFVSTTMGTNLVMGAIPPGGKDGLLYASVDSTGLITIYQGTAAKTLTNSTALTSNVFQIPTSGDAVFAANDAVAIQDVSSGNFYFAHVHTTNTAGIIVTNLITGVTWSSPVAFVTGDVIYRLVALQGRVAGNAQATVGPNASTNPYTQLTLTGLEAPDAYPLVITASKASGSVTNLAAFGSGRR